MQTREGKNVEVKVEVNAKKLEKLSRAFGLALRSAVEKFRHEHRKPALKRQ